MSDNKEKILYLRKRSKMLIVISIMNVRIHDDINWHADYKCGFAEIEKVIIRDSGRVDVYGRDGGVIYLEERFLIDVGLDPYMLRMFLLVMGKLCAGLKYSFIHEEKKLLDQIFLESYQGNVTKLIKDLC